MNIVNLTQHDVNIVDKSGKIKRVFKPSGYLVRVTQTYKRDSLLEGIQIDVVTDVISNLPEPKFNTCYIVSNIVKSYYPDRVDLLVPNTSKNVVRDKDGKIIGVRSFIR